MKLSRVQIRRLIESVINEEAGDSLLEACTKSIRKELGGKTVVLIDFTNKESESDYDKVKSFFESCDVKVALKQLEFEEGVNHRDLAKGYCEEEKSNCCFFFAGDSGYLFCFLDAGGDIYFKKKFKDLGESYGKDIGIALVCALFKEYSDGIRNYEP